MDKDMIHIDDLVRQKLGGAEEEERPGAWLRMRELLDKEMPVNPAPVAYNWRRMLSVAAGVLLLAAAGGVGYAVYDKAYLLPADNSSQRQSMATPATREPTTNGEVITVYHKESSTTEEIALAVPADRSTVTDIAANSNHANQATPGIEPMDKVTVGHSVTEIDQKPDAAEADAHSHRSTPPSDKQHSALTSEPYAKAADKLTETASNTRPDKVAHDKGDARLAKRSMDGLPDDKTTSTESEKNETIDGLVSNAGQYQSNHSNKTRLAARRLIRSANSPATNQEPVSTQKIVTASLSTTKSANRRNKLHQPLPQSATNTASLLNGQQKQSVQRLDSQQRFTLIRDTFQKITMRKSYLVNALTQTSKMVLDTLSIERIAIEKWVPMAAQDDPAILAAQQNGKLRHVAPVPLSGQKVKVTKTNAWDPRNFQDIVRDAKFNMAQIQFYPGITGGINTALFGAGGLSGFHLGMSSLFTFGEHWGATAELKFFQRFNSNTFDDNYYRFDSSLIGGTVSYSRSIVEHNFKFSSMQSLELPVSLRYNWGRFSALAGVNLAYNFRINAEQFDRQYDSTSIGITPFYNRTNSQPTVGINDFNARFTGGYLLGVNYQITPAVSFDLRMTQQVWNSLKGAGAEKVFNRLYSLPSFQFSVGYRFSKNPRFPVAR